jgi:pimeloyl-ACP methyl ester carboxylesterase
LHGSPNSSRALEPLIAQLAGHFDCIAFDTPGNGLSDPLSQDAPTTDDYATALGLAVDALQLRKFHLYGFHTGAGIAAAYMATHPDRIAAAVLDGIAAWTESEKAEFRIGYLPPFIPTLDGAHLAWLWSRVMEQQMFFPWHRPSNATRMDYDMAPPLQLQEVALDFLRAGDHYRKPYAAALSNDGAARLRCISTPTLVTAHPLDPLAAHFDRLTDLPDCIEIRRADLAGARRMPQAIIDFLSNHDAGAATGGPVSVAADRGFAHAGSLKLHWIGALNGTARPLLLLHDAGGSSRLFADAVAAIAATRPVIAVDLPGHGESDGDDSALASATAIAEIVGDVLAGIGLEDTHATGFLLGGQVALELKRTDAAASAAMIGAPFYSDAERDHRLAHYAPDLSPRWDGGHLSAAWHFARLRDLYDPWTQRDRGTIYKGEPLSSAAFLHDRVVDLLKSQNRHRAAYAAQFRFDTAEALASSGATRLYLAPHDPSSQRIGALHDVTRVNRHVVSLAPSPCDWGATLANDGLYE